MRYDPAVHHRRSIRLKGHNYAGGGVYFVTICAHRELLSAMGWKPFTGALRALIEERLRITAGKCPQMRLGEWVIMPDHFHALVHLQEGPLGLGDVIGGFKAAVSREWNRSRDGAAQGAIHPHESVAMRAGTGRRVIACPAWGIEHTAFAPGLRTALEENRMLILEMRDVSGNLAAAEARNRFVIAHADALFTPHVTPGGMLDRLLNERSKVNAS